MTPEDQRDMVMASVSARFSRLRLQASIFDHVTIRHLARAKGDSIYLKFIDIAFVNILVIGDIYLNEPGVFCEIINKEWISFEHLMGFH